MSGSAQVWVGTTVMQHGSFTRSRSIEREAKVFRLDEAEAADLALHTLTLRDAVDRDVDDREICEALRGAFEDVLDVRFEVGEVTAAERVAAESLLPEVVLPEK